MLSFLDMYFLLCPIFDIIGKLFEKKHNIHQIKHLYSIMDLSLNNKFLFIFISAESETTFGISKSFGTQNFIFHMLKFMGIEIIHASFQIDWTKILGFFRKKFGFSFFSDIPVFI